MPIVIRHLFFCTITLSTYQYTLLHYAVEFLLWTSLLPVFVPLAFSASLISLLPPLE